MLDELYILNQVIAEVMTKADAGRLLGCHPRSIGRRVDKLLSTPSRPVQVAPQILPPVVKPAGVTEDVRERVEHLEKTCRELLSALDAQDKRISALESTKPPETSSKILVGFRLVTAADEVLTWSPNRDTGAITGIVIHSILSPYRRDGYSCVVLEFYAFLPGARIPDGWVEMTVDEPVAAGDTVWLIAQSSSFRISDMKQKHYEVHRYPIAVCRTFRDAQKRVSSISDAEPIPVTVRKELK